MSYRRVSNNNIRHPTYNLLDTTSGTYQRIAFGKETDKTKPDYGKDIVDSYYLGSNDPYMFTPEEHEMTDYFLSGKAKYMLIQMFEFSPEEYKLRFNKEYASQLYMTDYAKEQTVFQDVSESIDYSTAEVRRLLFLIDTQTGKPVTDYLQYESKHFNNDMIHSFDPKTGQIRLVTPYVCNGKLTAGPRKFIK